MAYIYKITNKINQKIYIGQTSRTIEERWREHQKDMSRKMAENRPLYRAMNKYGIENFVIEQIEECSEEQVNEREVFWIEYFGSFKNGYNATIGGEGRSFTDYDLIYATYLETKSLKKTAELTGHDREAIGKAIRRHNDYQYPQNITQWKPVAKLDKNTGEILEVYSSVIEAENNNGNTRHITDVCNGKRQTCKGFKWRYI